MDLVETVDDTLHPISVVEILEGVTSEFENLSILCLTEEYFTAKKTLNVHSRNK